MSCTPPIISAHGYRASLYKNVANLDVTNSLTTGEAINDTVLEFPAVIDARLQVLQIVQVRLREVAATSSDIKKPALALHLWHGTAPAAPVANTVYATPVGANYLGVVEIATADYRRLNATTWEAAVSPMDIVIATDTAGAVGSIFGVALSGEAAGVTFVSGAALSSQIVTRLHNTLGQLV